MSSSRSPRLLLPVLLLMAATTMPAMAAVSKDVACLQKATTERTKLLKTAYDTFVKDMAAANDKLQKSENDQLQYQDYGFRQAEIARTYSNYSYEVGERARDLSGRVTDAWNQYQQSRNACNAAAAPGVTTPTFVPPAIAIPGYGGGYGSYRYPYGYGSTAFGGYTSYMSFGYPNYYRAAIGCRTRPLAAPQPGCGYRYGVDSNGCPSYTPVCNNAFSNASSCTCSNQYAPVCGRDGNTYYNACYAVCLGATVQFQGTCLQY